MNCELVIWHNICNTFFRFLNFSFNFSCIQTLNGSKVLTTGFARLSGLNSPRPQTLPLSLSLSFNAEMQGITGATKWIFLHLNSTKFNVGWNFELCWESLHHSHLFNRSFSKSSVLPAQWFRHFDYFTYLLTYLLTYYIKANKPPDCEKCRSGKVKGREKRVMEESMAAIAIGPRGSNLPVILQPFRISVGLYFCKKKL